jgi:hypothetical protein
VNSQCFKLSLPKFSAEFNIKLPKINQELQLCWDEEISEAEVEEALGEAQEVSTLDPSGKKIRLFNSSFKSYRISSRLP